MLFGLIYFSCIFTGELCKYFPRVEVWEGTFIWQKMKKLTSSRIFPNLLPIQHCWLLYYSGMAFCYYSTPSSSHGKCISVFGTNSPSFLGNMKVESTRCFFSLLPYLFHRKWSLLNSFFPTLNFVWGGAIFLTICGILILSFNLGFILFNSYFYAASFFLCWIFCNAHLLSLLLKGKQHW